METGIEKLKRLRKKLKSLKVLGVIFTIIVMLGYFLLGREYIETQKEIRMIEGIILTIEDPRE